MTLALTALALVAFSSVWQGRSLSRRGHFVSDPRTESNYIRSQSTDWSSYSELYWVVAWNLTYPGLDVFSATPSLKLPCYAALRWYDFIKSCSHRDGIERSAVLIGPSIKHPCYFAPWVPILVGPRSRPPGTVNVSRLKVEGAAAVSWRPI